MRKKRVLAMLLVMSMVFQSFGTISFAAESTGIMETSKETIVENTVEEEKEAETVQEKAVTENTVEVAEETKQEEAVTEDIGEVSEDTTPEKTVTEEIGEESIETAEKVTEVFDTAEEELSDAEHLVDTSLDITLSNLKATAGSYHAQIEFEATQNLYNCWIIYTTEDAAGELFFPGETSVWEDNQQVSEKYKCSVFNPSWEWSGNVRKYSGQFTGDSVLKPNTKYYFRLAQRKFADEQVDTGNKYGYKYHFLTMPESFTTGDAVSSTQVSLSDFKIESTGYNKATVSWTVNNPANEYLAKEKVMVRGETGDSSVTPQPYRDENGKLVPDKYSASIVTNGKMVEVWLDYMVYTGEGTETSIKSETIQISPIEFQDDFVKVDSAAGAGSFQVTVTVDPWYKADNGWYLYCYYRTEGEVGYQQKNIWEQNGVFNLKLENLISEKTYEYYLVLGSDYSITRKLWQSGSPEDPLEFTTTSEIVYEDSEFPDDTLRNYLKKVAGVNQDGKLTNAGLEKVASIRSYQLNGQAPVTSLEGIQYCINLTELELRNHDIADAEDVSKLTKLTYLDLYENDLTKLPDLSELKNLRNVIFDTNLIEDDSFTEDRLPAKFLSNNPDWLEKTKKNQREKFKEIVAENYYAIGDTHPFIIQLNNVKPSRQYTISVKVADSESTVTKYISSRSEVVCINNLGNGAVGEQTIIVNVTDQYGRTWIKDKSYTVNFKEDENTVEDIYVDSAKESVFGRVSVSGTYGNSESAKLQIIDGDVVLGVCDKLTVQTSSQNENRYQGVFNYYFYLNRTVTTFSGNINLRKNLPAGDYDLKLMNGNEEIRFEKVVHIRSHAVINSIYQASAYDSIGDYVYISVYGVGIDKDKIHPVLYKDHQPVTEFVSAQMEYEGTVIYKLKKLDQDTCWGENNTFEYKFIAEQGYQFEVIPESTTISIYSGNTILFRHYNYKKGVYQVKLNSDVKEGAEVLVKVFNNNTSEPEIARAQGKISNGMLELIFKDSTTGAIWTPPKDVYKYFSYTYVDRFDKTKTVSERSRIEWYNYYDNSTVTQNGSVFAGILYYEIGVNNIPITAFVAKSDMEKTESLAVDMKDSNGNVVGEGATLTYKSDALISQNIPAYRYEGTWSSSEGLTEVGKYSLQLKNSNIQINNNDIWVYSPDVFYMYYQDAYKLNDGRTRITFASEKLYADYVNKYDKNVTEEQALDIWNNNLQLEIFDCLGNKIDGWKVTSAKYEDYRFYVYINNLPEDYAGFYFKITDKDGNLGINLKTDKTYYSTAYYGSEKYGLWKEMSGSSYLMIDSQLYGYNGVSVNNHDAWPVQVTVSNPYDTTELRQFEVSGEDSSYYFTASDLSGLSKDEVYRIVLKSADGSISTSKGYLVSEEADLPEVEVADVKLDKTSANLSVGKKLKLTATVVPDNATDQRVTWNSDNEEVATVNENGEVTAIGAGTAKITVTTNNGKTATCTVKVLEYSITSEELNFDLYSNKTPVTLKVSDGITEGVAATWSSSNAKIATVSSTGKVTPVGVGEATIQAVVKNGPTFTCHVTVKNDIIERIELSHNTLVLNADDTVQLKANVLPKNTTLSTEIIWSSSDEDAVSVDKEGNVTALKEGASATITATASNGVTASCEVKVYQYKLNETELNFDLYNNKTPITLKVSDGTTEGIAATWTSENPSIATVVGGKVTPVGVGTTTITAAIKNGPELTCKVTVTNDYIKEVTLDKTTYEMTYVEGPPNETVILKAFVNPADTTLSKNVTWESSNTEVATVDENGTVTAVGAGTAEITVQATADSEGNKSEPVTCTITVYGEITAPEIRESLFAITNSQAKLKDVELPSDSNGTWSWENPETTLKQFACMGKANFTAIYTPNDEFVRPVKAEIPVRLVTISKLTLEADKTTIMMAGNNQETETAKISPKWVVTGDETILDEYEAEWKSSNEKVATVENGVVSAVGKGSAKISAVLKVGGRDYTAAVTIKVLENQKPAEITVKEINVFGQSETNDAEYIAVLKENKDANKGYITVELKYASKLTVSNSNAKVVKTSSIKAVKGQTGIFEIPFELLEGGTAKITLTANDSLKTTKDIWLTVKDAKPSMEVSALNINKLQSLEETFMILPSKDYPVTEIVLDGKDAEKFDLEVVKDTESNPTGECVLRAKESTGKSNGYKVNVIATANGQQYSFPLTVKVTEVKAKVSVKQSGKINLFYTDSKAELMFTTAENITKVTLDACDYQVAYDEETESYIVKPSQGITDTKADKAGVLEITLEGWMEPLKVNYTVGVEKKAPKLALTSKSGVLYPAFGINSAQTSVLMDGKAFVLTDKVKVDVTDKKGNEISGYGYECEKDTANNLITFTGTEAKNAAVIMKVKDENWNDSVTLSYALTVKTNKPAVKLSKSTVQLNVNKETFDFDVASTQVMWKDATEFAPEGIIVEPADAKAKGAVNSGLEVEVSGDQIVAKLNSRTVTKGTYKFKVSVKASDAYTAVTTLNVKVVDTVAKKSIGLSTKGSIDVLNRSGSYVTVTPKLSAINGTVTGVTLSGRNADLFTAELVDGIVQIRLKDNVSVITNYSYGVKLNLEITNEDEETMHVIMDEIKLSLKQGSVKLAASPASGVLYSNADCKVDMEIKAIISGANNPEIEKIKLLNYTDAFEYDDSQKELTMKANGEAAKGKSYTLQFEITLKDKADNVKPIIFKYKVTVK